MDDALAAVSEVAASLRTCYGPLPNEKLIVSATRRVLITSSGATARSKCSPWSAPPRLLCLLRARGGSARHPRGKGGPLGTQPLPRVLERGASTFDHPGATILSSLVSKHPLTRLVIDCASAHVQHVGDGGCAFVLLLHALLLEVSRVLTPLPPTQRWQYATQGLNPGLAFPRQVRHSHVALPCLGQAAGRHGAGAAGAGG